MHHSFKHLFLLAILTSMMLPGFAQHQTEAEKDAYTNVITQRAEKIVKTLDVTDPEQSTRVRGIIVNQYRNLSAIHDSRDARVDAVKRNEELTDEKEEKHIRNIENQTMARLEKLRRRYLKKLSGELTPGEVDKVKDGMTYGVLPVTYRAYLEMIPGLTEAQKTTVMKYLLEAREHAMDAGSSEKKHEWFGKYKGRINNYLSDAGYDLKKAGEGWEKRRRAEVKKDN